MARVKYLDKFLTRGNVKTVSGNNYLRIPDDLSDSRLTTITNDLYHQMKDNQEEIELPNKDKLRDIVNGRLDYSEYYWTKNIGIMYNKSESIGKEDYIENVHKLTIEVYNKLNRNKIHLTKNQDIGVLDSELNLNNMPYNSDEYENDVKSMTGKSQNSKSTITQMTVGTMISILATIINLSYLPFAILTVILFLGIYVYNNKSSEDIKDKVLDYKINKTFVKTIFYRKGTNASLVTDSHMYGISPLLDFINAPYKLDNGLPVRLYQLLYLDNGRVKVSHTTYYLGDTEGYKVKVLPDKLTECNFKELYDRFLEDNKRDKEYIEYKKSQDKLEQENQETEQALYYLKEYNRLSESVNLGLIKNQDKWEYRKNKMENKKGELISKNKRIINIKQ